MKDDMTPSIRKTSRQCGGFFNDHFRDALIDIIAMRELHMTWPVISGILGCHDDVLSARTESVWAAEYSNAKKEGILPSPDSPEVVARLKEIKSGLHAIFAPKANPRRDEIRLKGVSRNMDRLFSNRSAT